MLCYDEGLLASEIKIKKKDLSKCVNYSTLPPVTSGVSARVWRVCVCLRTHAIISKEESDERKKEVRRK